MTFLQPSHKKRKDSLEGSLDRVLFAAELEFPKILVLGDRCITILELHNGGKY